MAQVAAQLQAIAGKPDQKQKLELYKQLLQTALQDPSVETLNAFVDHSARPRAGSAHALCMCARARAARAAAATTARGRGAPAAASGTPYTRAYWLVFHRMTARAAGRRWQTGAASCCRARAPTPRLHATFPHPLCQTAPRLSLRNPLPSVLSDDVQLVISRQVLQVRGLGGTRALSWPAATWAAVCPTGACQSPHATPPGRRQLSAPNPRRRPPAFDGCARASTRLGRPTRCADASPPRGKLGQPTNSGNR